MRNSIILEEALHFEPVNQFIMASDVPEVMKEIWLE